MAISIALFPSSVAFCVFFFAFTFFSKKFTNAIFKSQFTLNCSFEKDKIQRTIVCLPCY